MASLIQDNRSGLYYAQFYDKQRRPQRKTVPLKTTRKRIAERTLVRLDAAFLMGDFDPWAPPPEKPCEAPEDLSMLGPARSVYLASCSHLKPKTVVTYDDVLRPFVEFIGEDFPVNKLSSKHILAWLDTTNANDVTRRKYTKHLGYLFRFLMRRGFMEADISKKVKLRRVPEQAPKAMLPEEVEQLVETIETYNRKHQGHWRRPDCSWLARLVELNVYVGLRRGELVHLRWEHIDREKRILRVVNSEEFTTKSSKERTLPLCDKAMKSLAKLYKDRCGPYVFHRKGQRVKPGTLTHAFARFRVEAGLPDHINLHATRHTFATWLAEKGVPVMVIKDLMGHSTVTTTERYMRVHPTTTRHWIEKAFSKE